MSNLEEMKEQLKCLKRLYSNRQLEAYTTLSPFIYETENAIWTLQQRIREAEYQALDPEVRFKLEHGVYGATPNVEQSDK